MAFLFFGVTLHSNIKLSYVHNRIKQRDFLKKMLGVYVILILGNIK